jgi:hypothetical protein
MFQLTSATETLQTFFTVTADRMARTTGFVERTSKVTGAHFLQTLTFGFLENPEATLNELAQVSEDLGVVLTAQGLDERLSQSAVAFLRAMFAESLGLFRQRHSLPVELLERFSAVYLLDSSTLALPDHLQDEFPGCGGDGPLASLKVQVVVELRFGRLQLTCEAGRSPDQAYVPPLAYPAGSLRLSDLGYFNVGHFEQLDQQHDAYFLSRLNTQTGLYDSETDQPMDLLAWLQASSEAQRERSVRLGATKHLPVRLIAMRLPPGVVEERRRKANEQARRKGRTLSERHRALLAWGLLVTNAPAELLSADEAVRLYPVRWQIELVFKLWKSQAQLDRIGGWRRARVLCELYAKLIGLVLTHLLSAPLRWLGHDDELSLTKAFQSLQRLALRLARSLPNWAELADLLALLQARWRKFGVKNKHKTRLSTLQALRQKPRPTLA